MLAGVTLFGGVACGAIWLYDRSRREFLWSSVLASTMTLTLLCGAVVFEQPGIELARTAAFLRSTLYGVCVVLAVHTAALMLPGLAVRRVTRALLVVLAVRTTLGWPTDFLVHRQVQADGFPQPGPLAWTFGLFNVGLVLAGVLVHRRSQGRMRPMIAACGVWVVVFTMGSVLLGSGPVREETLTLQVLPGGIAVLFLAGRTLLRTARGTTP